MARQPRAELPTGTVTFLFTDIEGSTALLVDAGDAYQSLLETHSRLLRSAFDEHGGVEVNTEGDAFFVAFRSAVAAVRAAADAQRALAAAPWPDGRVVGVRIGLHTGEGRLGGDDYAGLDVNRAARIAAAAHGGQTVLSERTRTLVESELSDGLALRDLGRHRLKDLPEVEHLWQLEIEGLSAEFPALRTLDSRATNLPADLTALLGRSEELERVRRLVARGRLVTLTGPGGTGKTRLAMAVAGSLLDDHPDGVFFVALQHARDRGTVASEIASVIGVRERPDRDLEGAVDSYLADRHVLLVLDNFEQAAAAAGIVSDLLSASAGTRVIATSREALRISGEQEYEVPTLAVPDETHSSPAEVISIASVALFVQRAQEVRSDFRLTEANAAVVIEICRRLDGLPLAIELAAARTRSLDPASMLARMDKVLPLLSGGPRDRPERQQTLRAAIDWSHDLLDAPERQLFARLSIFAGGWPMAAAERVCVEPGGDPVAILDGLTSLLEKSLIKAETADTAVGRRFRMLAVIREYAADRLALAEDADRVGRRHAGWVADLVEEAEPELVRRDLRAWQLRLRAEEDNIRAALAWSVGHADAELGMRIAGSLWRFWHYWGEVREGVDWLERVLALPGGHDAPRARAAALSGLAGLRYWQGDARTAEACYQEVLDIRRATGDRKAIADALYDASWSAVALQDVELHRRRRDEAIAIYHEIGDEARGSLARAYSATSDFTFGAGGSYEAAYEAMESAAEANERHGMVLDATEARASTSYLDWIAARPAAAYRQVQPAVRAFDELGHVGRMGSFFKLIAALELALDRPERAVRLAAAAARHADELGGEPGGGLLQVGDPLEEGRQRLAPETYDAEVLAGRAMSLPEAVAYVLEGPAP